MDSIPKKDIYHIYELEARDFKINAEDYFWKNLLQTGVVFVFLTFVVFFMINFRFISSQLVDWYDGGSKFAGVLLAENELLYLDIKKIFTLENDSDGDGLSDKLEIILGTSIEKSDSDGDGFGDFQELSQGYSPFGEGKIRAEIEIVGGGIFPVDWEENNLINNPHTILVRKDNDLIFNKSFFVSSEIIENQNEKLEIKLVIHLDDGKILEAFYQEKTREISGDNFDSKKKSNYEAQIISGWPKGADWKRLIIETELISLNIK